MKKEKKMKIFWCLFKINFIRIINTWMMKFLLVVCVGGIGIACFVLQNQSGAEEKRVCIEGDSEYISDEFYQNLKKNGYQVQKASGLETEGYDISVKLLQKQGQDTAIFNYADAMSADPQLEQLFQEEYIRNLADRFHQTLLNIEEKIENEDGDQAFTVFMVITIIIYLFIIVCGGTITSSVALEKVSKVSELLIYRISSLKLIYSKISALFVSVLLVVGIAGVELLVIYMMGAMPVQFLILGDMLKEIRRDAVILLVLDACLGVYLYTLLYTMVGMTVMEAEQLQYAQLPATIVLFISYGIGFFACFRPDALLSKISFFIPVATPFVAPAAIMSGAMGSMQILASVLVVLLFIIICNMAVVKYFIPNRDGGGRKLA